jgi:hypothetical protein
MKGMVVIIEALRNNDAKYETTQVRMSDFGIRGIAIEAAVA